MSEKPITTDEKRYNDNKTGKFVEGNPGRPEGTTNKFNLDKLIKAIEAEEEIAKENKGKGMFQRFAEMAYNNPGVMIALMKKFIPDKQYTEIAGLDPIKFEVEILNGDKKSTSE